MVRIHEIKLRPEESEELLLERAEKKLRLPKGSLDSVSIARKSLDSRKKPEIYKVYSLDLNTGLSDEALFAAARRSGAKLSEARDESYSVSAPEGLAEAASKGLVSRPVVAGFGPCGMFAGLALAACGLRPLILERGSEMKKRVEAVESFWGGGGLSTLTNVQFGEGGAGTFSDGKLTTGTKDPAKRFVLESFVSAGASPEILYLQHPHIGTDVLRGLVVNIRKRIQELGGELRFETELVGVDISGGALKGVFVRTAEGEERLDADALIIALGHSARDTVRALYAQGLMMEQKQFSMGVRIEHKQRLIDIAQYGAPHEVLGLPPAEYKLNTKCSDGRGVYTFCMCPGGRVVASASQEGGVVTNGMSDSDRAGENANSALLCDVRTEDFPSEHPLAGIELQERYERLAFELGASSYRAPAQRVGDFLDPEQRVGDPLAQLRRTGELFAPDQKVGDSLKEDGMDAVLADAPEPSYRPGIVFADIEKCLPDFVSADLREALPKLGRRLQGFDDPSALLTAVESRSSAPFRIKRDAQRRCLASDGSVIEGLFPGGEGAGYAGGIMSAACDGVHLAEAAMDFLARRTNGL
ncbi:MAG: hypothetical protein II971_04825 [Firmicutes bacterium]|nr:hypothetical protein [Bacillota bacterium]